MTNNLSIYGDDIKFLIYFNSILNDISSIELISRISMFVLVVAVIIWFIFININIRRNISINKKIKLLLKNKNTKFSFKIITFFTIFIVLILLIISTFSFYTSYTMKDSIVNIYLKLEKDGINKEFMEKVKEYYGYKKLHKKIIKFYNDTS